MLDSLASKIEQIDTVYLSDTVRVALSIPERDLHSWITNPNTMIAFTAIIISVLGLFLSSIHNRRTFKLTKKHNELSVKPLLHYSSGIDTTNGVLRLTLSNRGLGPAIIKSLVYNFEDKTCNTISDLFNTINNKLKFSTQIKLNIEDKELTENATLSPKDFFELFSIRIEPTKNTDEILTLVDKIKIDIKFQDIYGNKFDNI